MNIIFLLAAIPAIIVIWIGAIALALDLIAYIRDGFEYMEEEDNDNDN